MAKTPRVPIQTPMFNEHRQMTRPWIIYLQRIGQAGGSEGRIAYNPEFPEAFLRDNWYKHGERPSVKDWGAVGDGAYVNDVAIAAAGTTLTSASNPWVSGDEGKSITVDGAGVAGAVLKTTIASFTTSGEIELTDAASTAVIADDEKHAWWGTDDSAAINLAIQNVGIAAANEGGELFFPPGTYIVNSPIMMAEGVTLAGPTTHNRYAFFTGIHLPLQSQIKAGAGFPVDDFVIDGRNVSHIGFHNLEVTGDGTSEIEAYDATSTGIGLGAAGLADDQGDSINVAMSYCSITNHKRGVWAKNFGGGRWYNCNIGPCWHIGIDFERYAGNDGTYTGIYINSCNYALNGILDPLDTDIHTAIGLRLGFGCSFQTWDGGKIEWNGVGVLLDEHSFNLTFSGVMFDQHALWSIRVIGTDDPEDIMTAGHQFIGCTIHGSCWNEDVTFGGLDAHVLIEGKATGYAPVEVGADFRGCSFRATKAPSPYPSITQFPQTPESAVIATRVTGSGVGKPPLHLSVIGCDLHHGSIASGEASVSGTTVTRVSGTSFGTDWAAKEFRYWFYNGRYTIASVTNGSSMELTQDAGTLAAKPFFVETNKIIIDADFSAYSEILIHGNRGHRDYQRRSIANQEDMMEFVRYDGSLESVPLKAGVDGAVEFNQLLLANRLSMLADQSGLVYLARYTSGYPGAVIDAYDAPGAGAVNPEFISIRVAGVERLYLSATQCKTSSGVPLFLGGQTIAGDYVNDGSPEGVITAGPGSICRGYVTGSVYVKASGTGNTGWVEVVNGQVDLSNSGEVDGSSLTSGRLVGWDGNNLVNDAADLGNADDVDGAGLTNGRILSWDGNKVVNGAADLGDANDVDGTGLTSGELVKWDGNKLATENNPDVTSLSIGGTTKFDSSERYFPYVTSSSAEPTLQNGEMRIWIDTDTGISHVVFRSSSGTQLKVALG